MGMYMFADDDFLLDSLREWGDGAEESLDLMTGWEWKHRFEVDGMDLALPLRNHTTASSSNSTKSFNRTT
jgi:hypothetical protein